jgi:hypothetical protein
MATVFAWSGFRFILVKLGNVFEIPKRLEGFFAPSHFGSQLVTERGGFAAFVAQGHTNKPLSRYGKIEKRG